MAASGTVVNVAELLSVSLRAARAAGVVLRNVASASLDLKTVNKAAESGGWDPQTAADRQAQAVIIKALTDAYPGLPIVGEEDSATPLPANAPALPMNATTPSAGIVQALADACPEALKRVPINDIAVFVDPLDATRAFVAGQYQYVSTLIGIAVQGAPVAGVVARPFVPAAQHAPHGAYSWGTGWVYPRLHWPASASTPAPASETGSVGSTASAAGSASRAVAAVGAAAVPTQSWSMDLPADHIDVLYGIVGAGVVGAIDAADSRLPANQRSAHAAAVPTGSVTPCSSVASMAGDSTTDHAAPPDLAHSVLGPHHKRVTPAFPAHFPTRVTTSFARSGRETEELLVSLGTPPSHRISSRGAGCKGVEVLRGAAGLYMYPKPQTSRWDTAAVEALLMAMGGALYNTDGKAGKSPARDAPPANRAAHKYNYVWTEVDRRSSDIIENKHGVFASQYPALARCALRNKVGMPSVHALLRKQGWGASGLLTPAELDTAVQQAVDASRAGAGANTGSREGRPHVCSFEVLPPIANDDFTPPPPHTPTANTGGGSVSSSGSASPYLGAAQPAPSEGSVRLRLHWGMLAGGRDPPVDAAPLPKSLRVSLAGWGKCPVANAHHVMMLPSEVTLAPPDKPLGGQKRPRAS